MMMKRPIIKCSCCNGGGVIYLPNELWRTLKKLSSIPKLTSELNEVGITPNAICNRLKDLESLGLAKRSGKTGKWIKWVAVEPQTQEARG